MERLCSGGPATLAKLLFVVVVGCGSEPPTSIDGGAPPPPEGSGPIDERPCPDGYRISMVEAGVLCEPWPEEGPDDCPDGHAHFPGGPGCEPLSPPCPDGPFPSASTATIFVDPASSAPRPDGSPGAPFSDVAEGVAAAGPDDVVQLANDEFTIAARLFVPSGVTLRGACTTGTVLAITGDEALRLAPGGTLEDLTVDVRASAPTGVDVEGFEGGTATLRAVHVKLPPSEDPDRTRAAVSALGTPSFPEPRVELEGVRLEADGGVTVFFASLSGERVDLGVQTVGVRGMTVSTMDLTRVSTNGAIAVSSSGSVSLTSVVAGSVSLGAGEMRLTNVSTTRAPGDALVASPSVYLTSTVDSIAELRGVHVRGSSGSGVHLTGDLSVVAEQVLVTDVHTEDSWSMPQLWGSAVVVDRAELILSSFYLSRAELCGVHVGAGASVDASRGVVSDSTIGACIPSGEYDLSRLMDDVRFRNNATQLQTESLPVPEVDSSVLGG